MVEDPLEGLRQERPCVEPGCDEMVRFLPEVTSTLGYLGNETVSAKCPSGHENRWFPKLGVRTVRALGDE
jgi:hypothetical protein